MSPLMGARRLISLYQYTLSINTASIAILAQFAIILFMALHVWLTFLITWLEILFGIITSYNPDLHQIQFSEVVCNMPTQ